MLIRRDISEQELVLYIAIRRNAYSGRKCTQAELGKLLELTERSISRITKQMVANGLIIVEPRKTGEFIKKGSKTIEKTFNYYIFPLEYEDEESPSL
jgi:DNA-binding MarR family transcriptional regulator